MKKLLFSCFAILGIISIAGAATFSADGGVLEPTHGYTNQIDRVGLVNDGSFEDGTCLDGLSGWTCSSDGACDWITDLAALGLWNYDGIHTAWIGGFCGNLAVCYSDFCQDLMVDGGLLSWYWMGYINYGGIMPIYITVDGVEVYSFTPALSDHLLDFQNATADISAYNDGGMHTICFGTDNTANCGNNEADNYFFDYVEILGGTATEDASFSSVKTLY